MCGKEITEKFMATNASTWFYSEPEHQPYLIEERVNHTFWSNRITAIHLHCVNAEVPFRMEGMWHDMPIILEWAPKDYLTLTTGAGDQANTLIVGVKEILGFKPTISYVDAQGTMITEWHTKQADQRIREIQQNSSYRQVIQYK